MKITVKIDDLEQIISKARQEHEFDDSLAMCVEIEQGKPTDIHGRSDSLRVRQLSGYAECNPKTILYINF